MIDRLNLTPMEQAVIVAAVKTDYKFQGTDAFSREAKPYYESGMSKLREQRHRASHADPVGDAIDEAMVNMAKKMGGA